MEHCSSQPANKPQLRVREFWSSGTILLSRSSLRYYDGPSLSLVTSKSVAPVKGVSGRYSVPLFHPSTGDSRLLFHSERRSWLTSNIRGSGNQNQRWPGPHRDGDWVCYLVYCHYTGILYSILIWRMLQMEFTTPARPTETPRQLQTDRQRQGDDSERLLSYLKWRHYFLSLTKILASSML